MKYFDPAQGFLVPGVNASIDDPRFTAMTPISDDQYANLIANQAKNGVQIGVVNGVPQLVPTPGPTKDKIKALNDAKKQELLQVALVAMSPYQSAADLGIATEQEKDTLNNWKVYQVALNRIDTTATAPVWPTPPAS